LNTFQASDFHSANIIFLHATAKQLLKIGDFQIVLEEDGSILPDEIFNDVIDEGVPLQLLMLLQQSEKWTPQGLLTI